MFPSTQPNFVANGNVSPCRFITPVVSSTGGGKAVQASAATQLLIGVSYEETRYPPGSPADDGYMAIATENLPYHGPGQICNLQLGDDTVVSAHMVLTADAEGKGTLLDTTLDTKSYAGAIALQPGVDNDKIMVWVLFPNYQLTVHT